MMPDAATGRLTRAAKAALLDNMRRAPGHQADVPAASHYDTSFESLPGYREIGDQRALLESTGVDLPFYRRHDVRAGARSAIAGQPVVNFASYDYLGLNGHPEITAAVGAAATAWGTSVSASRITAGERGFHAELEQALADVYEAEACLAFVSGHATAISTIAALMSPRDLILHDALIHNCVAIGAQLSGASRRNFAHNDLDALDDILRSTRDRFERVLIVSEGLYSMDGDGPDLARLVEIKERHGCWLMVDDAHALGVVGATGRGIFEQAGVDPRRVDIWLGTLSKSLVSCGGYVAGRRSLVDYLKLTAPGMVYSVGLSPPAAVAALTALRLMQREPGRVARLQANGQRFLTAARRAGLEVGTSWGLAITPVVVGDSLRTLMLAERLLHRGYNAFPIVPPGVPERSARLRFFLSSEHTDAEIDGAVAATREELTLLEQAGVSLGAAARRMMAGVPA